jgi:hypothetical protein
MIPRLHRGLTWTLAGAIALACAVDLEPSGAGKACVSDGRCASGYVCSAEGLCVLPSPAIDSGTAAGHGGSGGQQRELDAGGVGGAGGSRPVVDARSELPEAADAAVQDQACGEPVAYYADDDQDGFGRADAVRFACTPPSGGWAAQHGDCDDTSADVFPGQTSYFGVAYSGPHGDSFDYDCSGSEDPDPAAGGRAPDCAALGALDCRGSGFAATGRTGSGINPLCGSKQKIECTSALLACAATTSSASPAKCR